MLYAYNNKTAKNIFFVGAALMNQSFPGVTVFPERGEGVGVGILMSEHLGSFQKKPADALRRDKQAVQMLHGTVEFEF